ncbi:MAG: exodeoxyribonuclease VII large subunit [Akkermansia sp.]|nr:exodeoxyribonuclease VII large subunit [Akkermansia sp.]
MAQSVTELLARLKWAVEAEVGEQSVVGEIGSCKMAGSGHVYFTLKDATAQLQCVLYRYQAAAARVRLREGLLVELTGKATVWEGRGSLQFVVSRVKEAGTGSLQQQFEALKRKLEAEGLFSAARKRPLPRFPQSVGLITSATGAVIQDMRHRLEQRAPWIQAYLLPVQVQGKGAELGIARAINHWSAPAENKLPPVDYLILARGGGSMEDLWCFNEEIVARAIAACSVPVVSAIGHETDFTIADFVADLRAPTPTAAIELSTPDSATLQNLLGHTATQLRRRLEGALNTAKLRLRLAEKSKLGVLQEVIAPYAQQIDTLEDDLKATYRKRIERLHTQLQFYSAKLSPRTALSGIENTRQHLAIQEQRIFSAAANALSRKRASMKEQEAALTAASPQNALDRGFALVRRPDGLLARNAADLPPGTMLHIRLAEGEIGAQVL